ncbi:ABC transporter permease [Anaerocolumna sp. AGMB13025]|uniref:ABC transporter permease n=1 Tax=Anaerocolumna sp. AGMB13025 TaxID=3039116 RepID=UPI00241E9D8C|nr:ABC transporter permease [Anaerocolumna sp. AGMB13025]WFR57357.1 ABC transporter permease [Anaerocolumna sp. AGMB13025]
MKKYIAKRVIISVITLLVILLILFLMLELMPGSPFNDEKLTDAQRAVLNAKYGLDQPIVIRFVNYIKSMLSGDFGVSYSISKNTPITALLETRLPISLRLGGQAILIGTIIGLILGIIAAIKHNTIYDTITTVISVLGVSLPSYVFAMTLIYSVGFKLKWLPLLYQEGAPFKSSIMPTISLCMFTVATVARFTRTEMLEVLGSDYMLLAESKGINSFRLIFRHALRNALIPIITVLAPLVVGLMTGSLVIEKLFSIPGIGSLLVSAIQSNDYNVVVALTFIYSLMYIGIMLVVDILYGVIDPRIRLAKDDTSGK